MNRLLVITGALALLCACDPYAGWPDETEVFPHVYAPETDLEAYHEVRWETETWDPASDLDQAALYLLKALQHRPGASSDVLTHFGLTRPRIPSVAADDLRLSFAGDVMWVEDNYAAYAEETVPLFDGDLRLGNLETPTYDEGPTDLGDLKDIGAYVFNAPSEMLDGLPFDVLQVNNNHSIDMGDVGLAATIDAVEERGMVATGANQHTVYEVRGERVAILTYTWGINQRDAETAYDLNIVPFGHIGEDIDLSPIAEDIAAARTVGASRIVLMVHWGFEYEYYPDPHFMVLGRELVKLGADVVVGHGTHTPQPAEICEVNRPEVQPGVGSCSVRSEDGEPRTAAILYSLGNFGSSTMPNVPLQVGIVGTVTLGDNGVTGLGWSPVAATTFTDGRERLVPLDEVLDEDPPGNPISTYPEESARLDVHLGAGWRR